VKVRHSLARNTFWYGIVTVIGLVAGIVMSVILARGLGPTDMGEYSYVTWASRTLTAIATLGFALGTMRYTASAMANGDRDLAWGFVQLMRRRQLVATAIVAVPALMLVLLVAPDSLRWPLAVVCVGLFPITLEHIWSHAVQGAQRYDLTTQVSTIKMGLQLSFTVVALALGFGILGVIVGSALGTWVSCWLQYRRSRSIYPDTARPVPEATRREVNAYLLPLSVVVVLDALVWDRSEIFFLRLWSSADDVAFYSLAFGLATKAMILPEITVGALMPTFAALHGRRAMDEFERVYRHALRYVALAAMPIAAIGIPLAPAMVRLLYGEDYVPVVALFSAMAGVAVFAALRRVAWAALRGLGDRRCAVSATTIAAILNLGLAALLIPRVGTWGAVAANTAAQLVATTWAFAVMSGVHRCRFPAADVGRVAAAAGLAGATTLALAPLHPDLIRLALAGSAGLLTFLGAAIALRTIGAREWALVVSWTRRLAARPGRSSYTETGA
jgi:O-antigen/teichoic acid export membrane protein